MAFYLCLDRDGDTFECVARDFETLISDIKSGQYDWDRLGSVLRIDVRIGLCADITAAVAREVHERLLADGEEIPWGQLNWLEHYLGVYANGSYWTKPAAELMVAE